MAWGSKANACRGEARSKITGKGLTDDDVRAIRALPLPYAAIAEQFGISIPMVSMIRSRKRWGHVRNTSCMIG